MNGGVDDCLSFVLDEPLPAELEIGNGAVLLIRGSIAPSLTARLRGFVVELDDGERQSFDAHGQIRFELPNRFDRTPRGVFLPVRIEGRRAGTTARLRVSAVHHDGTSCLVDQSIAFVASRRAPLAIDTPIAICLATYNPDPALLERQLASLRTQTRRDWTCIIHDDGSRLDRWAAIEALAQSDSRFRIHRAERNRGFYRNFEAALALVPSTTPYVALCDQDDVWFEDKLAVSIERLQANPRAQLVYSDMRIVRSDGEVVASTYWNNRRNNFRNFDTLLFANTVTGAASMLRGSLLDAALPFPPAQGPSFHDHWLACAAFVAGGLEYVDRPLYDYTQHGGNVIGHSAFGPLTVAGALRRHVFDTVEMIVKPPRAVENTFSALSFYYYGYLRLRLITETLLLRFPDASDELKQTLALFDDRLTRAAELMVTRHLAVSRRGDTTDGVEFLLGMGLLLHKTLVPLMRPIVDLKRRLLGVDRSNQAP
ncbi:MAG: methyltransferase protein [bacterium]|nr:methyltransferase protein [bacterium]